MIADPPKLITARIIATKLGVPLYRVQYVLRSRRHLRPEARADHLRLYSRQQVAMVRHELHAIDARRDRGNEQHEELIA